MFIRARLSRAGRRSPQRSGLPFGDASVIGLRPDSWSLRFDRSPGSLVPTYYYGLLRQVDIADSMKSIISHEARHSWQFTLKLIDGLTDADDDALFQNPPASSPELRDAAYPINPEFNFLGEASQDLGSSAVTAREWNAERFASLNVGGALSCAPISWSTVTYGGTPLQVTGQLTFVDDSGAAVPLAGVLVRIEKRAVGVQCDTPSGWTLLGYTSTAGDGWASYPLPSSGVYRFTLVPPRECGSLVVSSCATVP